MNDKNTVMIDLTEDGTPAAGDLVGAKSVSGLASGLVSNLVDEAPEAFVDEDGGLGPALPERARRNADGSVTLPLLYPVTLRIRSSTGGERSETYRELTFHRLNGGAIRAIQSASPATAGVVLLAKSAGVRDAVMNVLYDRMDGADITDAVAVVEGFFGSGAKPRK